MHVLYVFEYQCSHEEEGVKSIGLCYRRFHRVTLCRLFHVSTWNEACLLYNRVY